MNPERSVDNKVEGPGHSPGTTGIGTGKHPGSPNPPSARGEEAPEVRAPKWERECISLLLFPSRYLDRFPGGLGFLLDNVDVVRQAGDFSLEVVKVIRVCLVSVEC